MDLLPDVVHVLRQRAIVHSQTAAYFWPTQWYGVGKADAVAMKELMHKLDPLGNRPVSANQNGWVGTDTPLDVRTCSQSSHTSVIT